MLQKHGFKLPKMAWWLLVVSGFFHLSISLSNTFVNIFVFKVDHSFAAIAWYNLFVFLLLPFTFMFAARIAEKTSTAMALRIGIGLHALFYAVTLMVGERAAKMPALLGILMGLAAGFYWLAFDVLSVEFTDKGGHEPFFGIHGVLTSITNVIAPPVAGILISREDAFFGGLTGYHIVFGISFGLFLTAAIVSLRLHSPAMAQINLKMGFSKVKTSPWWRLMIASSIYGMREGVFMFLIGLLVFMATGSEMKLGEFLLLQGGLSFIAFYLAGRFASKYRLRLLTFGTIGMSVAATLFLFPIQATTVIVYGCLAAASLPLFLVPLQGYVYDGIDQITTDETPATTHIIVRESFENLGRATGTVLFIVICRHQSPSHLGRLSWLAFALGLVQIGVWMMIRKLRPVAQNEGDTSHIDRPAHSESRRTAVYEGEEEPMEGEASAARKRLNPMS